jgi:hypothetical protein
MIDKSKGNIGCCLQSMMDVVDETIAAGSYEGDQSNCPEESRTVKSGPNSF